MDNCTPNKKNINKILVQFDQNLRLQILSPLFMYPSENNS